MMQVMQANTFICVNMRLLRAQTKTAQNDRCKNLDSLLPMTKSIFLGTPPTSNRRKITILVADFLLSQVDQEMLRNSTSKLRLDRIPAGQYVPELSLAPELLED